MPRLLFLLLVCFPTAGFTQILINEIVASNTNGLTDFAGETPDWIELYNPTNQSIDLNNWTISDGNNRWQFPTVQLAPNEYLVLFASDKNNVFGEELHTNFKLKASGETITLTNKNDETVDFVTYPSLATDQSYGRTTNGGEWRIFDRPTPYHTNPDADEAAIYQTKLSTNQPSGFYSNAQIINILSNRSDVKIYYTTDGTMPTKQDFLYEHPLNLADLPLTSDSLVYVSTSTEWQLPKGAFPRAVVLRVRAFRNDKPDSEILTTTYFKTKNPHQLPVVLLSVAESDLVGDENGIYVSGQDENYWKRGRDWERNVEASFYDQKGELLLQQSCGLRLGGGKTRLNPQKTLRLHARSDYGESHFDYPFWGEDYGDRFKKITLRTLDVSPWSQSAIMDDFAHAVIDNEIITDYVRRQFVVVYINGVYWGIHSMREHNNEDFLARKYDIADDDIRKYSAGSHSDGTAEKFVALNEDLETLDLSQPADYASVAERLDVVALTDYVITNLAFANKDWPTNNLEWWSADTYDGKIRFIINDLDATMQVYNDDRLSLYFALEREKLDKEHRKWATFFLQKLLENADYRRYFNQRFNELLRTTFAPERTLSIWQELADELRPEMDRHSRRWHFPTSVEKWEKELQGGERFLLWRNDFLQREVQEHFGDPLHVFPNPTAQVARIEFELWQAELVQLQLIDMQGKIHLQRQISLAAGKQQLSIDVANLASGIYAVEVLIGNRILRQLLVKY